MPDSECPAISFCSFQIWCGGHQQLEGDNSHLMRPGGFHLNNIGLEIFLSFMWLQNGFEHAFFLLGGGHSPM